MVETVSGEDDGECFGEPRDRREYVGTLDRNQIGLETYRSYESITKCKSILWLGAGPTASWRRRRPSRPCERARVRARSLCLPVSLCDSLSLSLCLSPESSSSVLERRRRPSLYLYPLLAGSRPSSQECCQRAAPLSLSLSQTRRSRSRVQKRSRDTVRTGSCPQPQYRFAFPSRLVPTVRFQSDL